MHYYRFHIKDYRAKTAHLTPLEHYVYRTLIDWYYLKEKPFESVEQIARYLLLPLTDENRTAINAVLDEFFNFHKGKYYHSRIRQEIKDYNNDEYRWDDDNETGNATDNDKVTDGNAKGNGKNNAKGNAKALSASDRQARYKQRQKMLKALMDKGVTLDGNASFDDVCNAYNDHFTNTDNEKGNATDNDKVTQNNGKNGARTINHKPITNNHNINSCERGESDETSDEANPKGSETKQTTAKPKTKYTDEINDIFEFWTSTFGKDKNKTKLSDIRKRKITQRLEQGYTVNDIKTAIVNCSKSDYHMTGGHTDIELICRDEVHLDRFLAMKPKTTPQPTKFYGTPADPLAVNQKSFPTPENWEENLAKLLAQQNQAMGLVEI